MQKKNWASLEDCRKAVDIYFDKVIKPRKYGKLLSKKVNIPPSIVDILDYQRYLLMLLYTEIPPVRPLQYTGQTSENDKSDGMAFIQYNDYIKLTQEDLDKHNYIVHSRARFNKQDSKIPASLIHFGKMTYKGEDWFLKLGENNTLVPNEKLHKAIHNYYRLLKKINVPTDKNIFKNSSLDRISRARLSIEIGKGFIIAINKDIKPRLFRGIHQTTHPDFDIKMIKSWFNYCKVMGHTPQVALNIYNKNI